MRKISILTGSRADYGILKPLCQILSNDTSIEFELWITGAHLSKEHGLTQTEISDDGIIISERILCITKSDSESAMSAAISEGVLGFSQLFSRKKPDILVVLGDRYEILAACVAAYCGRIKIAHLCGGETSQGVLDEGFRHAITKFSSIHFTTTEDHKNRVIQMGEPPENVSNVGEIGLEQLKTLKLLSKTDLEQELGVSLDPPFYLCTYHPETLNSESREKNISELMQALCPHRIVFTKSNSDAGGIEINKAIDDFVSKSDGKSAVFTSLGRLKYLSLLKLSKAIIGNSSSGLIEAPTLRTPTINIGNRQMGRTSSKSVINCESNAQSIANALAIVESIRDFSNPYEKINSVETVHRILKTIELNKLNIKKFHDIT